MRCGFIFARLSAVAGGLALLAACGAGSGAAPVPASSAALASAPPSTSAVPIASPSPEPTYANALPGEKPPIRPPDVLSDAGAENFARYFVMTTDWAYASMDTALVAAESTADCTFCTAFLAGFSKINAAGDVYIGGRISIFASNVSGGGDVTRRLTYLGISYGQLEVLHADGSRTPSGGASPLTNLNLRVVFADSQWKAEDVKKVVTQ
jgi:hypothetical protein